LADVERDLIHTRVAEGRSRAQQRHGPTAKTASRGAPAAGGGCHPCRTRPQLQCQPQHDFAADRLRHGLQRQCTFGFRCATSSGSNDLHMITNNQLANPQLAIGQPSNAKTI
jgi:hypothetical protein